MKTEQIQISNELRAYGEVVGKVLDYINNEGYRANHSEDENYHGVLKEINSLETEALNGTWRMRSMRGSRESRYLSLLFSLRELVQETHEDRGGQT